MGLSRKYFVVHLIHWYIQGDSGGRINIFGGDSTGYFEKKLRMNMRLILNIYRDKVV
jgi:hypothetical protein